MLAPTDLQPAVVNHKTLNVAQGVERSGRGGVDERDKADVLVRDVPNVVQQTTSHDIADLLDGGLGVNVTEIDGPVSEVVNATSSSGNSSGSHGLLGQSAGNQVTVSTGQHVGVPGGNAEVLRGVLLLRLGDISTTILSVVHSSRCLPLCLLRKLRDGLDGIGDRQEVDEGNVLLTDDLDSIDGTELAKVLPKLLLSDLLRQVAEVYIPRGTRLLNCEGNRRRHLRRLAPANFDVLTLDAELFQDGIRVEVSCGAGVQEGDEGAVLVGKQTDRLDLATAHVAQDFVGRSVLGDVPKVDRAAGPADHGAHGGRARVHRHLHLTAHGAVPCGRGLGRKELRSPVGRGGDIAPGGHWLLHGTRHAILLDLLGLLVGIQVLELAVGESGRGARLEGASEEQLGRQQRSELHIKASARGRQVSHVGLRLLVDILAVDTLRVDGGDVATSGVSVGESRYVRSEGAVREPGVTVRRLRDMARETALTTAGTSLADGAGVMVLHPEEMRGDKVVPTDVR